MPPWMVLELRAFGHRAFKREIPGWSGVTVLPSTLPGLERVGIRLQKVRDLLWILCRCFGCLRTEHQEHGAV